MGDGRTCVATSARVRSSRHSLRSWAMALARDSCERMRTEGVCEFALDTHDITCGGVYSSCTHTIKYAYEDIHLYQSNPPPASP